MNVVARGFRLWRTVRHIPWRMLWARVAYKLRCRYYASPLFGLRDLWKDDTAQKPTLKVVPKPMVTGKAERGAEIVQGRWAFVGMALPLGTPPRTWFPPQASALWVFHLHYHEWLADLRAAGDVELARRLVADWMAVCGHWHKVAWHPYPLSLRVVAWLEQRAWLLDGADEDFAAEFDELLLRQVRHLRGNIEHWLGGNHVIKNLKALVYAGVCLPAHEDVLVEALPALLRELHVQVHADGGHYEASPFYHAQVLADVVAVVAVLRKAGGVPPKLLEIMEKMATALTVWRHADGTLALFNDGVAGEAATIAALVKRAGGEVLASATLPDTGYVRVQRAGTVMILDAGKVGPDENPGHAHADTLSLELDMLGERVWVNSGALAYQHKARVAWRGTARKNALVLDGENSAEVWGVFRVGRRPQDVGFQVKNLNEGDAAVVAWHDGYRHRGVQVGRKLVISADGRMVRGEDEVVQRKVKARRVTIGFMLAPQVQCRLERDDRARLVLPNGGELVFTVEGGRLDTRPVGYAPAWGVEVATTQLIVHGRLTKERLKIGWMLKSAA